MDVYAPVDAKDRHLSCFRSLSLEVSMVRQQVFQNRLRRSSLCQKSKLSVHNWFWFRTARPERIGRLLLVATALPHMRIPGSQAIIGKAACAARGKMAIPRLRHTKIQRRTKCIVCFLSIPGIACARITTAFTCRAGLDTDIARAAAICRPGQVQRIVRPQVVASESLPTTIHNSMSLVRCKVACKCTDASFGPMLALWRSRALLWALDAPAHRRVSLLEGCPDE